MNVLGISHFEFVARTGIRKTLGGKLRRPLKSKKVHKTRKKTVLQISFRAPLTQVIQIKLIRNDTQDGDYEVFDFD